MKKEKKMEDNEIIESKKTLKIYIWGKWYNLNKSDLYYHKELNNYKSFTEAFYNLYHTKYENDIEELEEIMNEFKIED